MTARKWLVAGLGNALQGADGFGPAVIERLRSRPDLPPDLELVEAHTDLLSLYDRFSSFEGVVLVDAVLGPGPRQVKLVDEDTFSDWNADPANCHHWSPLVAVKLFRLLQPGQRTRFVLVGLEVNRIDAGSPATPTEIESGAGLVMRVTAAQAPLRDSNGPAPARGCTSAATPARATPAPETRR